LGRSWSARGDDIFDPPFMSDKIHYILPLELPFCKLWRPL
jgi:hypothetical protein